MQAEQTRQHKMGTAPMLPLIFSMSLPAMFSMLVQALYNIVDSYFVAQVSEKGLAAVSLAFPLQNLLIAFAVGTSVGVTSLISRRLGQGRQEEANSAAAHGILLAICTWALFAIYGGFFSTPFFELFGLLGFPALGVAGAAIATVSGQILAMVVASLVITFRDHDIHISFRGFRPDFKIIKDIYIVGMPSIVMQSIGTVMTMALNGILSSFSTAAYTVFGLYFKLQSFVFMPVFGLNQGLLPILGFNYGARNKHRMMSAFRSGCVIALVIMTAGMVVFLAFPQWLLGIFNASEELLEIGVPALRIICTCFLFAALGIVASTLFQAVGRGIYSLIVSLMRQLVVLVPAAWILAQVTHQVFYVWWAFPIAECFSLVVSLALLLRLYRKEIRNLETVEER